MPVIDFHPSSDPASLPPELIGSLRMSRLDPKWLYLTPRQAELWRMVSLRHSPKHPEFRRIYEEAFSRIATEMKFPPSIELVGLGCGTGEKEAQLCRRLRKDGREIHFTGIDVSEALVREAAENLTGASAHIRRSLVCDLAQTEHVESWLTDQLDSVPRLITFFGLVPNFAPENLAAILRGLVRPQDVLLASVHLIPSVSEEPADILAAMRVVLPQYDNAETRAWLAAGLQIAGLQEWLYAPEMTIGEIEDVPAFAAHARWMGAGTFEKGGESFSPDPLQPLQLFQSLRYTVRLFEQFLSGHSLRGKLLAITRCGEEGIWSISHFQ